MTTKRAGTDSAPRRIGRPTRCTAKVTDTICTHIRDGLPTERAARLAGIADSTLYVWKNKAAEGRAPYADFMEAVTRAELDRERVLVSRWTEAATSGRKVVTTQREELTPDGQVVTLTTTRIEEGGDWRAAAKLLAVLYPDRYSERIRAELTGAGGGPIEVEEREYLEVPTDAQALAGFTAALAAAGLYVQPSEGTGS